jgi:hypothetical protein
MMNNMKLNIKIKSEPLCFLLETKKVNRDHILYDLYKENMNGLSVQRAICSIINSIISQRNVYFCLTRKSLINLVKEDCNWDKEEGFRAKSYPEIKRELLKNIAELTFDGKENTYSTYKVKNEDILKIINVSKEDEKAQLEFINNLYKNNKRFIDLETNKQNEDYSKNLNEYNLEDLEIEENDEF